MFRIDQWDTTMVSELALVYWAVFQLAAVYGLPDCGTIFLTVSSLWHPTNEPGRGHSERELELNWDPDCPPEWVGLFEHEPSTEVDTGPEPLVKVTPSDHPEGFFRTNVSLGRPPLPGGWNRDEGITPLVGDHCFPYWIGSFRNGSLLQADCFKIRPTWMWDHRQQLGPMPISSLFIPGTHNSGCHHKGATLTRRDSFARYLLTQDTDVWGQLVHGVRYLDLRVGYYPSKGKATTGHSHANRFWVNHDLIRVGPLLPVLHDIKQFLNASKGELVILDFHRFPVGFHGRQGRHRRLVALLNKELEQYAIPFSAASGATTLNQIWSKDRRLIIAYGESQVARDSKWLWTPINQLWGNQQTPSGLRNFLQRCMDSAKQRRENNVLWAAMAELTPTPLEVMFKPSGSLRQMADSINRNITTWFRNVWWQNANIVATDFFLANNLIDVSIAANLRKMNMVES
ncbi:PI-PLC X domain-containing protein 1 [Anabrus simplex]|uniref:PI-PLC X domain-containing protein 1 n=1 Tax=Anabrus simplex TaxID=316456 RepID=UPI0035A2B90C